METHSRYTRRSYWTPSSVFDFDSNLSGRSLTENSSYRIHSDPLSRAGRRHKPDPTDGDLSSRLASSNLTGRRSYFTPSYSSPFYSYRIDNQPISSSYSSYGKYGDTDKPAATVSSSGSVPKITAIDLQIESNSAKHHTDKYEICEEGYIDDLTNKSCSAQLVIRRGQEFTIKLTFDRDYDSKDKIKVIAKTGKVPLRSKGTLHEAITGEEPAKGGWKAKVLKSSGPEVTIAVCPNVQCAVGKWDFEFETVSGGATTSSQKLSAHAYILFNAWCKEDPVYMENDEWKDEYVLNDTGKVYTGNYKKIFGKPWNFGQFESVVLECVIWLLDNLAYMSPTVRGNPIMVTRKVSALVNSSDESGILTGRWDGNYKNGTSPTKWTGSVAILRQYMENHIPVRYGQCWVFSGVTTTLCRALGIPARSVTNFASAHDTDGSLTIDTHWNEKDEPMPELDTDSIWNFHVWNEVWMARPDLAVGYGGWQAIDATPQETSDGVYCAGPASVNAIKQGDTSTNYDTPFIFAEVNADKVHWSKQADGTTRHFFQRDVVGKNISTKAVGASRDFSYLNFTPDREDITNQYKFTEGTAEERAAVWRAAAVSTKPSVYGQDVDDMDVKFKVIDLDDVYVGSGFDLPIEVVNTSNEQRTVFLTVTLSSVYYTGVNRKKLKTASFKEVLEPNGKVTATVTVSPDDYMDDIVDHSYYMKISYLGNVQETKQSYANQDDFRLQTIIPEVKSTKDSVKKGEKFNVKVQFRNPLDKPLTGCVFSFESAGNLKPVNIATKDIGAGELAECECEVTAKRPGECIIITAFECQELGDLQGQCTVKVQK